MHNATHRYTTDDGTIYVRVVVDRGDGTSTVRVVSDQRSPEEVYLCEPGDQIIVSTAALTTHMNSYTFGSAEGYNAILDRMTNTQEHYDMSLNYEDFKAVLMGLRELSRSDTASDSIRENADDLIASIAETLDVELI